MELEKIKEMVLKGIQKVTDYDFIKSVYRTLMFIMGTYSGKIAFDSINPEIDKFKLGVIGMLLAILVLNFERHDYKEDKKMMEELPKRKPF